MVNQNNLTKKKGFTLLEMIVSVGLFAVVMVIVLTSVLTIIDLNRKTQALASLTNNMNAATESMVRLIKSGERDFVVGAYSDCGASTRLSFVFYDAETIFASNAYEYDIDFIYVCDEQSIYRRVSRVGQSAEAYIRMTPEDVNLTNVEFRVDSVCQDKVNIVMEGEAGANDTASDFVVQTTATRRSVVGTGGC